MTKLTPEQAKFLAETAAKVNEFRNRLLIEAKLDPTQAQLIAGAFLASAVELSTSVLGSKLTAETLYTAADAMATRDMPARS